MVQGQPVQGRCAEEEYGVMEIYMEEVISVEYSTVGKAEETEKSAHHV